MKKTALILAGMLLLLPLAAETLSGEPLIIDMEKAVDLALENNLQLKTSALNVQTDRRAKDSVWNSFIPTASANIDLRRQEEILFEPNPFSHGTFLTPSLQLQLNLNVAMFTGIEITRLNYEAGLIDYETARIGLERDVRKAFYGLIATRASLELLQKNIDTAQKRYEQAEANYENGLIPELNVLSAQVAAENMKPSYHAAETQFRNSLMFFKLLLGLDRNQAVEIEGSLDVSPRTYDAEELIGNHIASRYDVQGLNKALEIQEASKRATFQMERTPSVVLAAGWSNQITAPFEGDSWDSDTWSDTGSFAFTLSIPLDGWLPGSQTSVKLKEADDGIESTRMSLEMVIQNAEIEIATLVMNLNNSRTTLETYGLNVELARKAYDMTAEAYNLGTKEFLEVESAQNDLFKAEQDVLMEKFSHLSALLDLAYALNTPPDEIVAE